MIIGLIIGGILVGQDLIKAAAVRSQISQIDKYTTAVNTFQLKYNFLPGDIPDPNASQFGFQPRGQYPGEGDGNGIIEGVYCNTPGCNFGIYQSAGETAMFWVDMSNARFVDGGFSTATSNTIPPADITNGAIGKYLPQGKIGRASYVYVWSAKGINYFGVAAFYIIFGGNGIPDANPSMSVMEAYNIDKKMDDGLPQTGKVTAQEDTLNNIFWVGTADTSQTPGSSSTCYDNANTPGATQQYSTSQNGGTSINCNLSFQFQ